MGLFLDIAGAGLAAIRLHRLRSLVCVAALVAVLLPYLTELGLSKGLEAEADASARLGADLYVAGNQFGRPVPVPPEAEARVRQVDGVTVVTPRVIGEVFLGKDRIPAVVLGLPPTQFPSWSNSIVGDLPRQGATNELVVGTTIARRLSLKIGSLAPPFYRNDEGERLSRVVGLFRADAPLWQANLILTTLDAARVIFSQPGQSTDLLVSCRQGYEEAVSRTIERDLTFASAAGTASVRLRVTSRRDLLALFPRGLLHREGIFNLHFLLIFTVGILVFLVASGLGLAERRREIGILKATGWQTDQILLRSLVESLALSLTGACAALLLAWVWLRLLNGYGIAAVFLGDVGLAPDFSVPFRLTPIPALLSFVFSFVIVGTGSVFSSWRAATASPRDAMR
jgi:ABC-type lipoprotein release transport system permease subunit